jgi:hypothetical protein
MNFKTVFSKIWNSIPYRILFLGFSAALLFCIIIFLFINPVLNGTIKNNILSGINKNPGMHVKIDKLNYNIFSNSLNVSKCDLNFDDSSSVGSTKFLVAVSSIKFSGINWFRLLFNNGVSLSAIEVNNPVINIYSSSISEEEHTNKSSISSLIDFSFVSQLPERLNPFLLNQLKINSGKLYVETKDNQETTTDTIRNFSLTLNNINLSPGVISDSLNLILANGLVLSANGITKHGEHSGDELSVDSIRISSEDSSIIVKNLSFKPYLSLEGYFARKKYRSDRYLLYFPSLDLSGMNFKNLFWYKKIEANNLNLNNFVIDILTDKRLPVSPSCCPKMPNEILKKLNFKFAIKSITLNDGALFVKSLQQWSAKPAVLSFTHLDVKINNVCSIPQENDTCIINAAANLANAGRLNLTLNYPLLSNALDFTYEGSLDSMSVMFLNDWLEVENLVRLKKGKIDRITFSAKVKDGTTYIAEKPLYNGIQLKKLDEKDKGEETIPSFIFNTFILRSSNPSGTQIKTADIIYIKKNEDAFLDVLWIPIRTGLGKVVGF